MTEPQTLLSRRRALHLLGGAAAGGLAPGLSFAGTTQPGAQGEKRFVFLILRGGMDGLAALMPVGDADFAALRDGFAGADAAVRLDDTFALHPELAPLKVHYDAGDLLPVHAVATSHRGRSHFVAQDILESGLDAPTARSAGWVSRLAGAVERQNGAQRLGLSVGPTIPFALRGPVPVASVAPDLLPGAPAVFIDRMAGLWNDDAQLGPALHTALGAGDGTDEMMHGLGGGIKAATALAQLAADRLLQPAGPRIAVLDLNGFDTHSGEAGRLDQQFRALAAVLQTLAEGLQPVWRDTAILAVSEFGRTARPNGSGGTDHGTAGAAFLLGGAVDGGRVLADWPGLAPARLFEGRDLAPTLHAAALCKGIAQQHFGLDGRATLAALFPDQADMAPAPVIRA